MSVAAPDSFWNWSLDRYRREGVEDLTLRLQDAFGFNVNIVLWCCWCGENYRDAPALVLRKAIDDLNRWNAHVTGPLRSARRYLKREPGLSDTGETLRAEIKKLELVSEKIEQTRLQHLAARELSPKPGDGAARARRNLAAYAGLIGAAHKKDFTTSLLENLIALIFAPQEEEKERA